MLQMPAYHLQEKQPQWSFCACLHVCLSVQACMLGHNQLLCCIKACSVVPNMQVSLRVEVSGEVVKWQAMQRG